MILKFQPDKNKQSKDKQGKNKQNNHMRLSDQDIPVEDQL